MGLNNMSTDLRPSGKKQNNRKSGAKAENQLRKRKEAEARNTEYAKLTKEQKLARNSTKVQAKINKVG